MSPKKNTNKAKPRLRQESVNVNISSQKDVDAYVQFCDSLNGITNKNKLKNNSLSSAKNNLSSAKNSLSSAKKGKKIERPYFKVYKGIFNYDLSENAVILYSVIRNLIQIDYMKKTDNAPELDANGNSRLVGWKKSLGYDVLKNWSGISSNTTMINKLKELSDAGFISYKRVGGKSNNEFTLLKDMATYQQEEIDAIEKYMEEHTGLESEDDDFDW